MFNHRVELGPGGRKEILITVGEVRIFITRNSGANDILLGIDAPKSVKIDKGQPWPEQPLEEETLGVPHRMEELLRPGRAILTITRPIDPGTERLRDGPAA